jgi:hypothetical protein
MKYAFTFLICFIGFSCQKAVFKDFEATLFGHRSSAVYKNNTIIFTRTTALENSKYGVSFLKEGIFIENTTGFCGTPPISYPKQKGAYIFKDDIIEVSKTSFPNKFNWQIVSLTANTLTVKKVLAIVN